MPDPKTDWSIVRALVESGVSMREACRRAGVTENAGRKHMAKAARDGDPWRPGTLANAIHKRALQRADELAATGPATLDPGPLPAPAPNPKGAGAHPSCPSRFSPSRALRLAHAARTAGEIATDAPTSPRVTKALGPATPVDSITIQPTARAIPQPAMPEPFQPPAHAAARAAAATASAAQPAVPAADPSPAAGTTAAAATQATLGGAVGAGALPAADQRNQGRQAVVASAAERDAVVLNQAADNGRLVILRAALALQSGIVRPGEELPDGKIATQPTLLGNPFEQGKVTKISAEATQLGLAVFRKARGLDTDDPARITASVAVSPRSPEAAAELAALLEILPDDERDMVVAAVQRWGRSQEVRVDVSMDLPAGDGAGANGGSG